MKLLYLFVGLNKYSQNHIFIKNLVKNQINLFTLIYNYTVIYKSNHKRHFSLIHF